MRCNTAIGFGFGQRLHVVKVSLALRPLFIDVQWDSYDAETGSPLDRRATENGKSGLALVVLVLLSAIGYLLISSRG